jgi:hypothetical protein
MKLIASLIERARVNASIESDYRLAKIIGINQSAFGNYKAGRSMPNDKIVAQLCALSGDDPHLVMAQIQAERASSDEARNLWTTLIKRLSGGATTAILSVLFSIGLIAAPVQSARAGEASGEKVSELKTYTSCEVTFLSVQCFLLVRLRRMAPFWRLSLGFLLA